MNEFQLENARKYACYWIYARHIEDDTVNLKNLEFLNFRFKSVEEFNKSKTLNYLYTNIVDGNDIINLDCTKIKKLS
jgi:hypothetical protein